MVLAVAVAVAVVVDLEVAAEAALMLTSSVIVVDALVSVAAVDFAAVVAFLRRMGRQVAHVVVVENRERIRLCFDPLFDAHLVVPETLVVTHFVEEFQSQLRDCTESERGPQWPEQVQD